MRKAAIEKLAMLGDTLVADAVTDDIDTLHNAPSEELFDKAVALFMEVEMELKCPYSRLPQLLQK